jgi:predicted PurR-regulated permease PerM
MSNSRTVLESIPEHHRATGFVDLNLDSLPTERAYGISWDVQRDLLCFMINSKVVKPTRRNILSVLSSVFDPLGIAAPFILPGKLLLQELCRNGVDWDSELSDYDTNQWTNIIQSLPMLSEVKSQDVLNQQQMLLAGFAKYSSIISVMLLKKLMELLHTFVSPVILETFTVFCYSAKRELRP